MKATLYHATWCGPCAALKRELRKPENQDLLSQITLVDVDTKKGHAAASAAKVSAMPTLVREDGKRRVGVYSAKSLRKWLGES